MSDPDIILLVLDTLRADRSEPVWDVLEKYGFKNYGSAIAPSPWTIPSHASIFTGKYPILHGAHETKERKAFNVKIKDRSGFLSEELKKMGYSNYLLTANPYITTRFGYTGFDEEWQLLYEPKIDILDDEESKELSRLRKEVGSTGEMVKHLIKKGKISLLAKGFLNRFLGSDPVTKIYHNYQFKFMNWPLDKGAKKMVGYMKDHILKPSKKPRFVMINMMEVHEPYFKKPALSMKLNMNEEHYKQTVDEEFLERLDEAYEEEVTLVTEAVDDLLDFMRSKSLLDRSMIIITSDHGQLLGEHDQLGHGTFLADELLKVPLFIKYPKGIDTEERTSEGDRISLVSLYDLILGTAKSGDIDEDVIFSETVYAETHGISNVFEPSVRIEREKVERLERFKIAVYDSGYKMVFDVGSFDAEEVTGPKEKVPKEVVEGLKKKAISYLKQIEKSRIAKVKFDKKI